METKIIRQLYLLLISLFKSGTVHPNQFIDIISVLIGLAFNTISQVPLSKGYLENIFLFIQILTQQMEHISEDNHFIHQMFHIIFLSKI